MTGPDWRPRAAGYAQHLTELGAITDPRWREVFATVPRHLFVPRFWAMDVNQVPATLIDGTTPALRTEWLDAVYSDRLLVTQWTAAVGSDGVQTRVATSSASQPYVVAVMLDRLGLRTGSRVLEIGTGSGYNTALLCERVGPTGQVLSIDIHDELVADAGQRLARAGYRPVLRTGDGAAGVPVGAPYDAIIATCAVPLIPDAWIDQLVPGGRLVTPLTFGAVLAVLTRTGEREVVGGVDREAMSFMPLRSAADEPPETRRLPALPRRGAHSRSLTDVDPRVLENPDFTLWLTLHVPGVQTAWDCTDEPAADGESDPVRTSVVVYTAQDRATADYRPAQDGLWPVVQYRHRLWDRVEAAWRSFRRNGSPGRERLGIRAGTGGAQRLFLDGAGSPYSWPFPTATR